MGFGLAIDFTMSLMSIQPLFYLMGGPDRLFGFVFGCYDLSAMLLAPVFGWWSDHTRKFKPQVMLGAVVNGIGNLIYAFTVLADGWWIMLLGRLVAGVGAATLGIGSSYITQTTTSERRQVLLGRYRITQNTARMVGPFVGYLFLGLPNVTQSSSAALKTFNWYTVPGWAAFVLVAALLAVFAYGFEDPTEENEHRVQPDAADARHGPPTPARVARFRAFALPWLALTFWNVFAMTAFTSNLFALAAGQFHLVTTQGENWRTYIGVGCGAAVAAILYRRLIRWVPHIWEERKISMLSNWLLVVVWLLAIPYKGETWVPPDALFYAASGLSGFVVVINQAAIETVFSKKLTQYADVVGDNVGKWTGAYFMSCSAGRFAGPLVVAAVTRIATPSGETGVCTQWDDAGEDCIGPPNEQCIITGDQYWIYGCVLYHATIMYSVMAGVQFCTNVGFHVVNWRNWSYENEDLGGGPAADAAEEGKATLAGGGSGEL